MDLIPLGYNLETKYVRDYKDILKDDFFKLIPINKSCLVCVKRNVFPFYLIIIKFLL